MDNLMFPKPEKKRKKRKKSDRKKLEDRADRAMSLYVRRRDRRCVLCGSEYKLQAGHVLTRGAKSVRWDERNVFCQCRNCNLRHEYHPEIYYEWYINRFGAKQFEELIRDANTPKKHTLDELRQIAEYYRKKANELEPLPSEKRG